MLLIEIPKELSSILDCFNDLFHRKCFDNLMLCFGIITLDLSVNMTEESKHDRIIRSKEILIEEVSEVCEMSS